MNWLQTLFLKRACRIAQNTGHRLTQLQTYLFTYRSCKLTIKFHTFSEHFRKFFAWQLFDEDAEKSFCSIRGNGLPQDQRTPS